MPPSPLDSLNPVPTPSTQSSESSPAPFSVKFWGVRGSVPTPGPQWLTFGGNTACVEIRAGQTCLIFDGGTGLRLLGQELLTTDDTTAHLFFTHAHWDRIQGFPFFEPAFYSRYHFHIYGGTAVNGASIKQCLMTQMVRPNFPIALPRMRAKLQFHDLAPGDHLTLSPVSSPSAGSTAAAPQAELESANPGLVEPIHSEPIHSEPIHIETGSLNRYDRALGYRITWQDRTIVYATDVQPSPQPDPALVYLARGADLLIYDIAQDPIASVQETDPAQPAAAPCGSVAFAPHPLQPVPQEDDFWQQGLALAQAAGVKQLVLFHHHPFYDDQQLLALEQRLQNLNSRCLFAREGMSLALGH